MGERDVELNTPLLVPHPVGDLLLPSPDGYLPYAVERFRLLFDGIGYRQLFEHKIVLFLISFTLGEQWPAALFVAESKKSTTFAIYHIDQVLVSNDLVGGIVVESIKVNFPLRLGHVGAHQRLHICLLILGIPLNIQIDLFLLVVYVHLGLVADRVSQLLESAIGHDLEGVFR